MTARDLGKIAKDSVSAWFRDYAPSMGAALSYYTIFSLAPLLIIVIAVAGLVFGAEAAQASIVAQLRGLLGNDAAKGVQELLQSARQPAKGVTASVIGAITLILGATSVFGELQSALDRIWRAPAAAAQGFWGLLRTRLLSFGMVLAIGFLLLVSLVVSAALAALGEWWGTWFGGWEVLLQILNFVVSLGVITVLFALIYRLLPRAQVAWQDVWVGAAVTALLFTIGKFAIGMYLGKADVTSGFGAAGSIALLLVWIYYSSQVFLLGAEFTWLYAKQYGSRQGRPESTDEQARSRAIANHRAAVEPKLLLPAASAHTERRREPVSVDCCSVSAWACGFADGDDESRSRARIAQTIRRAGMGLAPLCR